MARPLGKKSHRPDPAQLAANMAVLPELCFGRNTADESLVVIKRGEMGFYPVDAEKYPLPGGETPEQQVTRMNAKMGVSPAQRRAMELGSVFGFDLPIANPETHVDRLAAGELREAAR